MAIKRILVPVDFSDDSLKALDYAVQFSAPFKAELVLLYVVEPVYYATPVDMYATSPNLALLLDEQRKSGKAQLARLEAKLIKAKRKARAVLKTGSPAQVIADAAKRLKADMIIMATHGRTGLSHVLLGSVAERVVRTAGCPVLTVRRKAARKR
jgi:nucleotide-binding universal stress UspA family protein